jgi:hypothetical protein
LLACIQRGGERGIFKSFPRGDYTKEKERKKETWLALISTADSLDSFGSLRWWWWWCIAFIITTYDSHVYNEKHNEYE